MRLRAVVGIALKGLAVVLILLACLFYLARLLWEMAWLIRT